VQSLEQGQIPKRSVVITFDDGFADNYHSAFPYLKSHRIPATIFLVTDCIEHNKPIWIQELYYFMNRIGVEKTVELLSHLQKELDIANLPLKNSPKMHWAKTVEEYFTYSLTKQLRDKILNRLYSEYKIQKNRVFFQNEVFLTWNQIKQMNQYGIAFGNHGASHTPFSAMPLYEQQEEIIQSKKVIETNLGKAFLPFAYPFGRTRDFTSDTQKLIKSTGHSCTLTSISTLNSKCTSPHQLGRILVNEFSVYFLAYELEKGLLKSWLKRCLPSKAKISRLPQ
jgi:peptidoglycan/xylan/chitin deacetylase (PgdA/CDA1 family)